MLLIMSVSLVRISSFSQANSSLRFEIETVLYNSHCMLCLAILSFVGSTKIFLWRTSKMTMTVRTFVQVHQTSFLIYFETINYYILVLFKDIPIDLWWLSKLELFWHTSCAYVYIKKLAFLANKGKMHWPSSRLFLKLSIFDFAKLDFSRRSLKIEAFTRKTWI